MNNLILPLKNAKANKDRALDFCEQFINSHNNPKYVLGRNVYAASVIKHITVDGIIDDYTDDAEYLDLPIVKSSNIKQNAWVLIASGGRPLSAKRRLEELGIQCLDYFSFRKYSGLEIVPIVFNEGFKNDFVLYQTEYEWAYHLLSDEISRVTYKKLVSFRLDNDLEHLDGFTSRENEQYFEDFLQLSQHDETFIDVGGFNGLNSLEFIRLCPEFSAVHIFEPDPVNYLTCKRSVSAHENVYCHQNGLSNKKEQLRLVQQGSTSVISEQGATVISVETLDDVLGDLFAPTLIKMDIEGAELLAIEGAKRTIKYHHPRLAICVYHKPGDFWRIPKAILEIREDYDVYMRHYTETIYETVMFFLPKASGFKHE